jgi:hypothetical protein
MNYILLNKRGTQVLKQAYKGLNHYLLDQYEVDDQRIHNNIDICQRNKAENVPYSSLLQPLLVLAQYWNHITMDFIEELPKSKWKDVILVAVDKFIKYAHFMAFDAPIQCPEDC